ncbi:tyrosine-type recombinase/integrase [Bdellovibrionota bacterium FG-2]
MSSSNRNDTKAYQAVDLPQEALAYLEAMKKEFAESTLIRHLAAIKRVYYWLTLKQRKISDISPHQLGQWYRVWCAKTQNLSPDTCDVEYYTVRTYLVWLIRTGYLPHRKVTDFFPKSLKSISLPSCALTFIEQQEDVFKHATRTYGQLFNLFHQWLSERSIELSDLKHGQVQSFLNFLDKRGYKSKPLYVRKLHMRIYLDWLRDRDLISCEYDDLFRTKEQYRNFTLPSFTDEYFSELGTHLSPETVKTYRTTIRCFYRFLHRDRISFSKLNRRSCVYWMEWMFEKEYSASTRLKMIMTIKGYLFWVVDRKIHRFDVNDLFRPDDLPQLDDFLPRPLPPSVDEEIQKRLRASNDVYHKGALLLRYTGLRLGDLERLAYNPIQKDEKGRSFLRVPPGKIKVERLLPIENRTIVLIEEIQNKMAPLIEKLGNDSVTPKLFVGRKKKSSFKKIYLRFKKLTKDLESPGIGSIYPHRLRHTYATSLLNAGIHPAVLMVLMGHTDLRMTFRYAKISIELVHRAYFTAYDQLQDGIHFPTHRVGADSSSAPADPVAMLHTVAKWINKKNSLVSDKKTASILNRLQKLTRDIQTLRPQAS